MKKEMKASEPIFKAGDRPEWTVDLIKQLPHGTELKCAVDDDEFIYNGQKVLGDPVGDLYIYDNRNIRVYFTDDFCYAKITSLPESYLNPVKPEEEFKFTEPLPIKAGDDRVRLGQFGTATKVDCQVISEDNYQHLLSFSPYKIDPDKELKELADEVLKLNGLDEIGNSVPVEIQMSMIKEMLIEMGKKVQDKIK